MNPRRSPMHFWLGNYWCVSRRIGTIYVNLRHCMCCVWRPCCIFILIWSDTRQFSVWNRFPLPTPFSCGLPWEGRIGEGSPTSASCSFVRLHQGAFNLKFLQQLCPHLTMIIVFCLLFLCYRCPSTSAILCTCQCVTSHHLSIVLGHS